ncbi:hypothetical protein B0H11DRAFT_1899293 [Mycena galericulata]|nr:hypothetical protein B0H11DRAFT_1899293 [Mycena galericulata]
MPLRPSKNLALTLDSTTEGKHPKERPKQAERIRASHREACSRYRDENAGTLRVKARERMKECGSIILHSQTSFTLPRYRTRLKEDEELLAEARTRARNASHAYRQKNAAVLAMRQRLRRREAFEAKYGRDALALRDRREQDARDAKRRAAQEAKWARQQAETTARVAQWVQVSTPFLLGILSPREILRKSGVSPSPGLGGLHTEFSNAARSNSARRMLPFLWHHSQGRGLRRRSTGNIARVASLGGLSLGGLRGWCSRMGHREIGSRSDEGDGDCLIQTRVLFSSRMTRLPQLPNPDQRLRYPCQPRLFPGPDFVDAKSHDETTTSKWYLVKRGRIPGLYTDSASADVQTNHFSGAEQKSFATRADALSAWMAYCRRHHIDGCPAPTLRAHSPPPSPTLPAAPSAPRTPAHVPPAHVLPVEKTGILTPAPTHPATPTRSKVTLQTRVQLSPQYRTPARTRPPGFIHPTLQFAAMGLQPPATSGPRMFYALRGIQIHFAERAEALAHATRMGLEGYELGWSSDLDELEHFIATEVGANGRETKRVATMGWGSNYRTRPMNSTFRFPSSPSTRVSRPSLRQSPSRRQSPSQPRPSQQRPSRAPPTPRQCEGGLHDGLAAEAVAAADEGGADLYSGRVHVCVEYEEETRKGNDKRHTSLNGAGIKTADP